MKTYRLVAAILLIAMVIATGCGKVSNPVSAVTEDEYENENPTGKYGKNSYSGPDAVYRIAGHCILDINGNGYLDQGEPGISGATVWLNDSSAYLSDQHGWFVFRDLPADTYSVTIDVPDGYTAVSETSEDVAISEQNGSAMFMLEMEIIEEDFEQMEVDTWGILYWTFNIRRAIRIQDGHNRGWGRMNRGWSNFLVDPDTLQGYIDELSEFALSPLNVTSLDDAYDILTEWTWDPVDRMAKQLLCAELNYMAGAWVGNNQAMTRVFLQEGEYMLMNPDEFTSSEFNDMKNLYLDFNTSWDNRGGGA